jgi:hypothetical protein
VQPDHVICSPWGRPGLGFTAPSRRRQAIPLRLAGRSAGERRDPHRGDGLAIAGVAQLGLVG